MQGTQLDLALPDALVLRDENPPPLAYLWKPVHIMRPGTKRCRPRNMRDVSGLPQDRRDVIERYALIDEELEMLFRLLCRA